MVEFDVRRKLPVLLLIDDDLVSREVTATVLTMSGYSVHTAASGESAVVMAEQESCASDAILPDVILMDTQMPGLNGVALIEALRSRTDAAIYAISASAPPAEVAKAADGFLEKPFGAAELQRVLAGRKVKKQKESDTDAAPEEAAVDAATLGQLRGMMPAKAVREIYEAVVADLYTRIKALEGAVAHGDAAEVRRIGHAIKGGCGLAGAVQAARLGALFEATATLEDSNQLDNSMLLLRDLRAATNRLERMLKTELADWEGLASGGEA
jgi:CheY-like chemotaxis protein/HPt (histidine-containing phosphotransfer) domain-containing protein